MPSARFSRHGCGLAPVGAQSIALINTHCQKKMQLLVSSADACGGGAWSDQKKSWQSSDGSGVLIFTILPHGHWGGAEYVPLHMQLEHGRWAWSAWFLVNGPGGG